MINQLVDQGSKVYAWILTHQGEHTISVWEGLPKIGVNHADELLYMFKPVFGENIVFTGLSGRY